MIDNQRVTKQDVERAQQASRRSLMVWIVVWVLFFVDGAMTTVHAWELASWSEYPLSLLLPSNMNGHNHIRARYRRQLDIDAIRASPGEQSADRGGG
jgi:hypothetical protein